MQKTHSLIQATLACFQHILKKHLLFHCLFACTAAISLLLFILFFSFLAESFFLAIAIACFFFACVMYFVGRLYLQEQKPEQFLALRNEYLKALPTETDVVDALECIASHLDTDKISLYPQLSKIALLQPYVDKLLRYFTWQDIHRMKELFLLATIDAHTSSVKQHPTSFEAHQEIATAYTHLARHYAIPLSAHTSGPVVEELKQKFRLSAERAIEELYILKEYAPNNPWVHKQLAHHFRELKMPDKEIEEYEALVTLTPTDQDLLYTLGTLYFHEGHNAKGLKVYEKLKASQPKQAQALIQHYGSTTP